MSSMQQKSRDELAADFTRFQFSNEWGTVEDPDTGRLHYRGSCGPGTIEFSYDPETEEVVNGVRQKIDMTR